jgi:hypothetical protein
MNEILSISRLFAKFSKNNAEVVGWDLLVGKYKQYPSRVTEDKHDDYLRIIKHIVSEANEWIVMYETVAVCKVYRLRSRWMYSYQFLVPRSTSDP